MINMVMLVGRLVREPEIVEQENGKKLSQITLAVTRKFKGADGIYHTDFIDCTLWNNFATNLNEYCHKGDLLGIRGRIETNVSKKDGKNKKVTNIIVENITFLCGEKRKELN